MGLSSDRTVLRQQDGGAPPRQVPRLRAQRSKESPSGAFKRQNGPASAGWRGPAPTSSAFASAAQQGKPQWGFQATERSCVSRMEGPRPDKFRVCERSAARKAPVGLSSDRTVLRQQDGGAPPRQVPRLRAQRSKESPSGAFKRQNGPASAGWRGPAPTSSAFASAAQQGKPQWGFQATERSCVSRMEGPRPDKFRVCERSAARKAPVGLSSDRTVLRQQDGGAPPRQVPRLRAQRSKESPSGAFKRQNGPASAGWRGPAPTSSAFASAAQQGKPQWGFQATERSCVSRMEGPRPDKFRVCERSAARKAPVGLSSDRTVLRQQDGGAPPRQVPRLRAQRSKESPSGDFRCFSLTNTLPVCYLYSIETASLLTERCGAPQCRAAGMSMPTVWAALRNCCAKLSFFAIKEDV